MTTTCFNCKKIFDAKKPICPHCFVVQREKYSREELFNYLEIYLPTKTIKKKQILISTKKSIPTYRYWMWFLLSIFTLGFGYQYYILTTLKALSDHWYFPHKRNESPTEIDMLTSTLLLFFGSFLSLPLLQYMRYEKLRRHCSMAPADSKLKEFTTKGTTIFWFSIMFYFLLSITVAMLVLGIGSAVFGLYFDFDSTILLVVFFTASGLILISSLIVLVVITRYERLWLDTFNFHAKWHQERKYKI